MDASLSDNERLAAAIMAAERRFPYFASGFAAFARRFAPVGTMAVTRAGVLLVDPAVLLKWSAPSAGEVVAHELLHLLRRHADRADAVPQVNRTLFNVAADAELNCNLDAKLLPDGVIFPATIGCPEHQLAEEYYEHLRKQAQQQKGKGGAQGDQGDGEPGDGESEAGDKPGKGAGAGKAKVAAGKCGSGSGGEPVDGEEQYAAGAKGRSAADLDRVRRDVAGAVQAHAAQHGRGSVPGGILVWAETELRPPKIRWEDRLRRAIRASAAMAAGRVDYVRNRPNRRQAAASAVSRAFGGQASILPSLAAPRPRVALAVDTSGSMGQDELARAVSEAQGVMRATGMPVVFLACDAAVHEVREVRTARDLCAGLKGGGGTNFCPVFDAVEKLRPRPDVLVFCTDGQGPAPEQPPRGIETIWVLLGKYATAPCTWGQQIIVTEN